MKLSKRSSLATVAVAVNHALDAHGIVAILTGGACASLHSDGAYYSTDLDFVLRSATGQATLDAAMATLGYRRHGQQFHHPSARFFVEFPRGPLAIGDDIEVIPTIRRTPAGPVRVLSATDSCRDRLAAFYHWRDRQSLRVAVTIAVRRRVQLATIQRWSDAEGHADEFQEFLLELRRTRRAKRPERHTRRNV